MSLTYDNLEDARSKLLGTIVYYDGAPVSVKDVQMDKPNEFVLFVNSLTGRGITAKKLVDPAFNFTRFNLGYANYNDGGCYWWYRVPKKQYQQGLRAEQLKFKSSSHLGNPIFRPSKPVQDMLTDSYPEFEECVKTIRDTPFPIVRAFNKDFAMSYDKIHDDLVIEYKGQQVGAMPSRYEIKLIEEFKHLYEPCKEILGVR